MSDRWVYIAHMSDGPHRTLNMRKPWKALAERADGAYSQADVMACVVPAVANDWNTEVSPGFLVEVGQFMGCGKQAHMFEMDSAESERLRQKASSPMESLIADNAKDALESPQRGDEAFKAVVDKTLRESVVRRALQVQEHYQRHSSGSRTAHMKARLQRALTASRESFSAMAHGIVAGARVTNRPPGRRDGLDDGPSLP